MPQSSSDNPEKDDYDQFVFKADTRSDTGVGQSSVLALAGHTDVQAIDASSSQNDSTEAALGYHTGIPRCLQYIYQ